MSQVPKKVVEMVKKRDNQSCTRCGRHGGNVHHRRMRSQSPKAVVHNVENLIVLCGSGTTGCHGWVHANPAESYENGWLVRSYQEPEFEPVTDCEGGRWILDSQGEKVRVQA